MSASVADLNVKLTASSTDMAAGLKAGGDALADVRVKADDVTGAVAASSVAIDKSLASARKAAATWNDESTVLKRLGKEHENLMEKLNEARFEATSISLIDNAKSAYGKEIARATVGFREAQVSAQREFESTLARLQASLGTAPTAAATARFDQAAAAARDIRDTKIGSAKNTYKSAAADVQHRKMLDEIHASLPDRKSTSTGKASHEAEESRGLVLEVAENLELLKKGVQFKAAKIIGETVHGIAEAIRELAEASRSGATIGEVLDHVASTNPVIGPWWEAGKAIREAITGEQAYIDEMKQVDEEMKRATATTIALRKAAEDAKRATGDIQYNNSGRAYVEGQTTTYGKSVATADVDYAKAARDAKREYDDAVKAADKTLGDSKDQQAINAHGEAIQAAAGLRDAKFGDAAGNRDRAKGSAAEQDQSSWQSSIDGMAKEQAALRGELSGETAEYARMHAEVDAMTSATAEQKQAAIDRWKAEAETTKTLRDQVAAKKQYDAAIEDVRVQEDSIGKSESEIKVAAFAKTPGATPLQVDGYRSALKSLDAKKLGEHFKDELKTPVDDAKKELADIQTAVNAGTLSGEDAAKLRGKLTDQLGALANPGLKQSGGPPADSLIVAGSDQSRNYVDALARANTRDLTKDQLDVAKQARDLLKTIAGNAAKTPQVVTLGF